MKTNIKDQIVLYTGKNGKVELRADTEKDTLWGTQDQIAVIFGTTKQNVGKHIKNIYRIGELKENSVVNKSFTTAGYSKHYKDDSTVKDSLIVGKDGKKYLTKLYNLDVIRSEERRVGKECRS